MRLPKTTHRSLRVETLEKRLPLAGGTSGFVWQPAAGPFLKLSHDAAVSGELETGWAVDEYEVWVGESGYLTAETAAVEGGDLENLVTLWDSHGRLLTQGYDPLAGR